MKVIAFLMKHAHGCRRYLLQVFGNVLLYVICGLVYPLIISLMIDHVIGNAPMENGMIEVNAYRLIGNSVYLDMASVGATANIMLAAVKARGVTVIENAAKEPHVVDLANFLNSMGADIKGAGTDSIKIRG